jgi:HSP20 family molecular chaperone IbpA
MSHDPLDEFIRKFTKNFHFRHLEFDKEFEKMAKNIDREFSSKPVAGFTGFRIEINDQGTGTPQIKVMQLGPKGMTEIKPRVLTTKTAVPRPTETEEKSKKCPVSKMLETNTGKVERVDQVILSMQVPGVKKEDVEIRPIGRTVEIVARKSDGCAYFGAFELPVDAEIEEKKVELKKDMLMVYVPRRKHVKLR